MTKSSSTRAAMLAITLFCALASLAQESTPPTSAADLEAAYTTAIEKRTDDILKDLALTDPVKADKVRDTILAQYRALRTRDEKIDAKIIAASKDPEAPKVERATLFQTLSKPLHEQFLAKLAAELTPEQIEKVKDKMTYNKVKVTYDAYGAIVPGLTEGDKTKILAMLKEAREMAIDGGSAKEKSDIFQKYKDQINNYLNAHGHDVAKAYRDWNAKQELEKKRSDAAPSPAPAPAGTAK